MRQRQYTITPAQIHAHASWRIQRHVRLADHGRKCRAGVLWTVLFWAASRLSSLAAACATLRDAPSDTAAHEALRRRRQPLAIDLTLLPYHGGPLHDPEEIYRSQAKSGTSHFHAYATAYVIKKGRRFTVALTAVGRHDPLPEVLQRLLRQAGQTGVRPRYLLLDRGFCSVEVIRYLQTARHAWLMPLTLRGRKANHARGPSGSRVFATWKKSGWGRYTMKNAAGRKARFDVCVKCRNRRGQRGRHGREALVYAFGGRLKPSSYQWVKETYRSRFAIETSYRQLHQARIRTSTKDPLLRLLYVGVALVLRNVWVWLHWEVLARRRRGPRQVDLRRMTFRQMLLWLQHHAEGWLGICEQTLAERPAWG